MPTWPSTVLPTTPQMDAYGEMRDTVIISPMDAGPPKVRRRFTAGEEMIRLSYKMTGSQFTIFRTFFTDTLFHGALAYNCSSPITGGTVEMRIATRPTYSRLASDLWQVSFTVGMKSSST